MDKIDKATRSRVMASVHSKNTKPEMRVRSMTHRLGYRFRLHRKDLPGSPDLVFPSRRVALFVHGCFWHGHDCKHGRRKPATNQDYWNEKIKRNTERDARVQDELTALGWKSVVIWECQLDDELSQKLTEAIG
ncbi:very short patch repair endonuclease [Chloroflexota bacterium]